MINNNRCIIPYTQTVLFSTIFVKLAETFFVPPLVNRFRIRYRSRVKTASFIVL